MCNLLPYQSGKIRKIESEIHLPVLHILRRILSQVVSEIQRVFNQFDGNRLASFAEIRKSPSSISDVRKNSAIVVDTNEFYFRYFIYK